MRTNGRYLFFIMILSAFSVLLPGCSTAENSEYAVAARMYGDERYADAEDYFAAALEDRADPGIRLGHAYNLIELGRTDEALKELTAVQDAFPDAGVREGVRRTILELYLAEGDLAGAADTCDGLAELLGDTEAARDYRIESAAIRADIMRGSGDTEGLSAQLRRLTELKTFAADEYFELYSISAAAGEREARLALADEIIGYMTGHSSYVTDYRQILSVIFDAAGVASHTEWTRSADDYFALAEEFIAKAGEAGLSENEVLKYRVIIAERQGKMEVAYNLLGVYLNHCPDDEYAVKEMDYLENRLGLGN